MKQEKLQEAFDMIDDDLIESVDKLRKIKKKPKRNLMRYISIAACFCLTFTAVFFAFSSGNTVQADDLMEGIVANKVESVDLAPNNENVTDFALRIFQASAEDGKNTLISPLSVLCALSMTANGADGETLAQMESVLGMSVDELNKYIYSYINSRPQSEQYKLSIANSIWFKDTDEFVPNRGFLQTNADYYGAEIYKTPFDSSALKDINNWVDNETDGMIPEILDEISDEAIMYLINALAFEAEWEDVYAENQIREGIFTLEDGTKQNAELMHSVENKYIESDNAKGMVKYYKNRKYAFVALLPDEGISISDYVASLNGKKLNDMLTNIKNGRVFASVPKFETDYGVDLKDALVSMGMPYAFDEHEADFTSLGSVADGNIFIGRVLHKTFMSVDEKGTSAGAATVVETLRTTGAEKTVEIYLDRPFVYMLIDCATNTPFFIGTMMNVNE